MSFRNKGHEDQDKQDSSSGKEPKSDFIPTDKKKTYRRLVKPVRRLSKISTEKSSTLQVGMKASYQKRPSTPSPGTKISDAEKLRHNMTCVVRFIVMLVITILITSQVPPVTAPVVANSFLFIGAFCFSMTGLLFRERFFAPYFTRYDVALWLLTLAALAACFVDLEALENSLEFQK